MLNKPAVQPKPQSAEFLTPEEVATYLNLQKSQVTRMLRTHCIPCLALPVGHKRKIYRISKKEFNAWCDVNQYKTV